MAVHHDDLVLSFLGGAALCYRENAAHRRRAVIPIDAVDGKAKTAIGWLIEGLS